MESYPEIAVHIDLTDRIVNLQEEGYDVVVRIGALLDSNLIAKRLAPDRPDCRRLSAIPRPEWLAADARPSFEPLLPGAR